MDPPVGTGETHTERRVPMQVCIVFTSGGMGCKKGMRHMGMQTVSTYETDSFSMNHGGRKLIKGLSGLVN